MNTARSSSPVARWTTEERKIRGVLSMLSRVRGDDRKPGVAFAMSTTRWLAMSWAVAEGIDPWHLHDMISTTAALQRPEENWSCVQGCLSDQVELIQRAVAG